MMKKIYKNIIDCNIGDILAADVINDRGVVLVANNTIINEYIKNKLFEIGISQVCILDYEKIDNLDIERTIRYENVKRDYRENILSVKKVLNDISFGKGLDFKKLKEISKTIYTSAGEIGNIIKCLNEVRDFDEYTYSHCVNVSFYSMLIAKWLELPEKKVLNAVYAGLLHDVGKMKISDEIINKKESLTKKDFEEIKKHTIYGYDIVNEIEGLDIGVKRAALLHHEREDSTGYPLGIQGNEINLYSKIVAVADVYDAMTSDRVYKKRETPFDVFEMFLTIGISSFDSTVLRVFLNNIAAYYVDANIALDNGKVGKIVYIPPHDITSPIISVDSEYIDFSKDNRYRMLGLI